MREKKRTILHLSVTGQNATSCGAQRFQNLQDAAARMIKGAKVLSLCTGIAYWSLSLLQQPGRHIPPVSLCSVCSAQLHITVRHQENIQHSYLAKGTFFHLRSALASTSHYAPDSYFFSTKTKEVAKQLGKHINFPDSVTKYTP